MIKSTTKKKKTHGDAPADKHRPKCKENLLTENFLSETVKRTF